MTSNEPYTMRSATDFLPEAMTTFVNLATIRSRNLGSGRILRFGTSRRRGMAFYLNLSKAGSPAATRPTPPKLLLGALDAVLGATLRAARLVRVGGTGRTGRVERAADDVVTHAGQILD